MNCSDVHRRLDAFAKDAAESSSDEVWQMLVAGHYVQEAPSHNSGIDLGKLQEEMRAVRAEKARAGDSPALLDTEKRLRKQILDASEAQAGARRSGWRLTRAGRELLDELTPRLARWGAATPEDFIAALEQVEHGFALLAASARAMATQHMKQGELEPLAQASAAVGLAASQNPAQALERFERMMGRLGALTAPHRATVAEAWADQDAPQELEALCTEIRVRGHDEAQVAAALALVAGAGDPRGTVEAGLLMAQRQDLELSSAVLLARTGRSLAEATAMVGQLQNAGAEPGIVRQIAVLLSNAPLPTEAPDRFRKLRQWIAAYTPNEASRSAALLTLLDADPPELLDDLRIAAEQVERAKLATGGMQALSLGAKLLLLRAPPVDAPASALVPGGAPAMAVSTFGPWYRSAIIVGHRNGFYAAALRANSHTSMHTHYSYG
jgi:hypothetical protein